MLQHRLWPLSKRTDSGASVAIVAGLFAATSISVWYSNNSNTTYNNNSNNGKDATVCESSKSDSDSFRIESHLMDRIQQKEYLSDAKDSVPSIFRVLAIDVPAMRTRAFTGDCALGQDRFFPDGVASPKSITIDTTNSDTKNGDTTKPKREQLKIAQKSLVRSIVQCSSPRSQQPFGVELVEASVANLNQYRLRKKQSFGTYTYDPGKYYDEEQTAATNDTNSASSTPIVNNNNNNNNNTDLLSDESEAPWNQYAWMEELKLRIHGHIEFGAPVQKSSRFERLLYGNQYKTTVPAVTRIRDLFLPSFARSDPDGTDGPTPKAVRARHKPHAVIANGASLQLVPSSLRLLQKLCQAADVPLFVVHDPRQWGGNTQASLEEALVAMRSTVKTNVIRKALHQTGSVAFARGRVLGQIETEAKWQLRDTTKRTRELLGIGEGGGRTQQKRHSKNNNTIQNETEDWSIHSTKILEEKLIEKNIIQVENSDHQNDSNDNNDSRKKVYSPELIEIARECIDCQRDGNDKERQQHSSDPSERRPE